MKSLLLTLLFLTGCTRQVSLQHAADQLDRVAISHNDTVTVTYKKCQSILNRLDAILVANPPSENMLDISVLTTAGKLRQCSKELADDWKKLEGRIAAFKTAAHNLAVAR